MVPCWAAVMPRGIFFLEVRTQFSHVETLIKRSPGTQSVTCSHTWCHGHLQLLSLLASLGKMGATGAKRILSSFEETFKCRQHTE